MKIELHAMPLSTSDTAATVYGCVSITVIIWCCSQLSVNVVALCPASTTKKLHAVDMAVHPDLITLDDPVTLIPDLLNLKSISLVRFPRSTSRAKFQVIPIMVSFYRAGIQI